MNEKQLTLEEKWKLDIESYKQSGGMSVTVPQCRSCQYWIKTDVFHCNQYSKLKKPSYIFSAQKECTKYKNNDEIIISSSSDFERRVKGGLWGAIVGDSLGVPLEFSDRLSRRKDPVKEMRAHGTYNQPFGTWSDDSSMMLCLIETINEGFSLDLLAEKFVKFASEGYMTPHDKVFDIGNAVMKAINNIRNGISPAECGGTSEYDNGNGSLMRILPLAFYLKDKSDIKMIECVSSVTHKHPVSVFACVFYIQMAIGLINGSDKQTAYQSAIEYIKTGTENKYENVYSVYERVIDGKISKYREDTIKSSGYVVDTLEAALWCFLNTKSYSECIFKAINLGGDTDTIACIAGGLAGIYYGIENINNNWIQVLAKKKEINLIIDSFYQKIST